MAIMYIHALSGGACRIIQITDIKATVIDTAYTKYSQNTN
jgi:hypothetical protein